MTSPRAIRIEPVDHTTLQIARQLHAVQMSAYAQEARLLGVSHFPPLERTVKEMQTSAEQFLAAFWRDEIVGAISVWPDHKDGGMNIGSLVVAPQFQRRGTGRQLMMAVLARWGYGPLSVQTGTKNLPALALYAQFGFVEFRRWLQGSESLELVKLRRSPGAV
jgi:GNAT superfamily N-acetyltransferase